MRLQNAIRRQKWRLRPLKKLVLPVRGFKRAILGCYQILWRHPSLRIEKSTADYVASHPPASAIQVQAAERVTSLPQPFLSGDAGGQDELSDPACIFELPEIDFWARYGGSLVTKDKTLLAGLSPEVWGVENHPIFSSFRLPPAEVLPGRTAILVTPEAPGNYYHWLIDLLPRVLAIKNTENTFERFDRILINGSRADYERISLSHVQVPLDKLRYVDATHRFQIARATIPSMDHFSKIVAPWKVRTLRTLRDQMVTGMTGQSTPKKIYVSRRRAVVRRILNEESLLPDIRSAGFSVIELESLPWLEQARLFSNADTVLAPHGAALANIVFCKPGTLIAEVCTAAGYLDFYLRLAASAGLRYRCLEAQPRVLATSRSTRAFENEDMILSESALKHFLNEL